MGFMMRVVCAVVYSSGKSSRGVVKRNNDILQGIHTIVRYVDYNNNHGNQCSDSWLTS